MNFETPTAVEQWCWQARLADWPRAQNRVLINELFSGFPPWTEQEAEENNQSTNYNDLSANRIATDARSQLYNAFTAPDPLFTVTLDYGPIHKRYEWGQIITKNLMRVILDSQLFLDFRESVFANVVLHGVGPSIWEDKQNWLPTDLGVEDVLIPSNTLSSMRNLPMFAIYRQYSGMQFYQMTKGPKVDPGWNSELVDECLKWVDDAANSLIGQNWPEVWSPEKMTNRWIQDSGMYASDALPTIDVFDFYFWNDEDKVQGWNRRMILDAWGDPGQGGVGGVWATKGATSKSRKWKHGDGKWLFNPGKRKYASKLSEILHFQFGDTAPVAPFYYHSRRSLGFLLYSVCQLQNRFKCRFTDSAFEQMLQYFRVSNPADMDRLQKVDLTDRGFLPEGLNFVRPEERWQVPLPVVEACMGMHRQSMADLSSAFTQSMDFRNKESDDETATRTMAKVNASAALVGSFLNSAYLREKYRYIEMCRRFCIKDSKDPGVRKFRAAVLREGVPAEALCVDAWQIEPQRVPGQGNNMLQVAIADKLVGIRPNLDPDAQKEVDRLYIAANTNNWGLARRLVPEVVKPSNSRLNAQRSIGTLMEGVPIALEEGINHGEYVEELLKAMAFIVKEIESTGNMARPDQVVGLNNIAVHAGEHLKIMARDKRNKPEVKKLGDMLGNLTNLVKGFGQRLQEQQQQQQGSGNGVDPKDMAKIKGNLMIAESKAKNTRDAHAQRTAQRQLQFEQQMAQKQQEHALDLRKKQAEVALDIGAEATKQRMRSMNPGSDDE